ncbi:MAG: TonB-dependent receptor plug domain-containing protein [Alistipes senegalensis]
MVGSVASVNAETLQQMPVASVAEAMTGRMAGVQITATEGDPDAEIRIRVRGAGTFSSDGAPLYIVDGFPVESISDISSSEIQSIDILKDAFSTAIYGSRGANGVVLITTKSGEKGKVNVNYKVDSRFKGHRPQEPGAGALPFGVRLIAGPNWPPSRTRWRTTTSPDFGAFSDIDLYDNVKGNDWMDQLFGRTGEQFNHNLTVSGGGDKFKWNATYARLYDKAIMVGSNYSRDNLGLEDAVQAQQARHARFQHPLFAYEGARCGRPLAPTTRTDESTGPSEKCHALHAHSAESPDRGRRRFGGDSSDAVMPTVAVSDSDCERERTNWTATGGFTWEIVDDLSLIVEAGMEEYRQGDQLLLRRHHLRFGGRRFGFDRSGNPVHERQRRDAPPRAQHQYAELRLPEADLPTTTTISNGAARLGVYHHRAADVQHVGHDGSARLLHCRAGGGPPRVRAPTPASSNMNYAADDILLSPFRTHQLPISGASHAFGHDAGGHGSSSSPRVRNGGVTSPRWPLRGAFPTSGG